MQNLLLLGAVPALQPLALLVERNGTAALEALPAVSAEALLGARRRKKEPVPGRRPRWIDTASELGVGSAAITLGEVREHRTEYDADGKEVWRKEGLPGPPYSVQRLDSGATLVACGDIHQIVEIAPDGTTSSINVQGRPMSAQRLDNGNTLCALQQSNRVVEVDRSGKIVWEIRTGNNPSSAVRLENGNTLVCLMSSRQVMEYDPTGKTVVWRSAGRLTNVYGAQRLPSGVTLVSDYQGLHEFDASGQNEKLILRQNNIVGLSSY